MGIKTILLIILIFIISVGFALGGVMLFLKILSWLGIGAF